MAARTRRERSEALRTLALRECRAIRRALARRDDTGESIHVARKAIRRLRSLLALVGGRVDGVAASDRALERLGEGRSSLRDAHVVIATASRLDGRTEHAVWPPAIGALTRRRDTQLAQALARDPHFARRRAVVGRVERTLGALDWSTVRLRDLRAALERSRSRARKAGKRAEAEPTPANLHRWRRRTRRFRMQLEATRALAPELAKAIARPSLRRELKALNRLGDTLGWQQDVQVLRRLLARLKDVPARERLLAQLDGEAARGR
jgi:CHAD domain-containing protein